jgi:hypothetical protein
MVAVIWGFTGPSFLHLVKEPRHRGPIRLKFEFRGELGQ